MCFFRFRRMVFRLLVMYASTDFPDNPILSAISEFFMPSFRDRLKTSWHFSDNDDIAAHTTELMSSIFSPASTFSGDSMSCMMSRYTYKSVFLSLLRQRLRTEVLRYEWKDSEMSIDSRFFHRLKSFLLPVRLNSFQRIFPSAVIKFSPNSNYKCGEIFT